jgi:hypothetical protein
MKFTLSAAALGVMSLLASGAHAQSIATQDASVVATGKNIILDWLPVTNSKGVTVYKDVTITLNVDGAGNLTFANAKPGATLSPTVSPVKLKAGVYAQVGNSTITMKVNGPQPVTGGGGADVWTITPPANNIGSPAPAIFYTGPLAGYPVALQKRIAAAHIATKQYIGFGYVQGGSINSSPGGCYFGENALFGIYIVGAQVIIDSFSCGGDYQNYMKEISYIHN